MFSMYRHCDDITEMIILDFVGTLFHYYDFFVLTAPDQSNEDATPRSWHTTTIYFCMLNTFNKGENHA